MAQARRTHLRVWVAVSRYRIARRTSLFFSLLLLVVAAALLAGLAPAAANEAHALPLPGALPSITLPNLMNPEVAATEPADGTINIYYDPIVSATFDRDMDPATLSSVSFYLQKSDGTPVPATLKYSTNGVGWYLYPDVILDPGITYIATLTNAARGANGLVLWHAPVTWSFTTVWFSDVSPTTPPANYVSTWDPALSLDHGQNARRAQFNHLLDGIPLAGLDPWGPMPRGEVAQVLYNSNRLQ